MRFIPASIILLLSVLPCSAQTYVMFGPSLTNTAGTIADKSNLSIELGRQWDAFSMGLDIGRTTLAKVRERDTTIYFELRPNLNVFQQGKFTNTLTTGIGFIFNAQLDLVTELTSGIEYSFTPQIHFNTYFGQYYYSGLSDASNTRFLEYPLCIISPGAKRAHYSNQGKKRSYSAITRMSLASRW